MSLGTRMLLSLLLAILGGYGAYTGYRLMNRATGYSDVKTEMQLKPARPIGEFEFTERSGEAVRLGDLKGDVLVVNFFFANCPMSCLQFTKTIAAIQKEMHDELDGAGVRFLSVTVDPANDTPERLKKYAEAFEADSDLWWFLTAPLGETQELGRALHVTVLGNNHTDELVLIDRAGTIRGAFDHKDAEKVAKFKTKLRELLAEPRPEKQAAQPAESNAS